MKHAHRKPTKSRKKVNRPIFRGIQRSVQSVRFALFSPEGRLWNLPVPDALSIEIAYAGKDMLSQPDNSPFYLGAIFPDGAEGALVMAGQRVGESSLFLLFGEKQEDRAGDHYAVGIISPAKDLDEESALFAKLEKSLDELGMGHAGPKVSKFRESGKSPCAILVDFYGTQPYQAAMHHIFLKLAFDHLSNVDVLRGDVIKWTSGPTAI